MASYNQFTTKSLNYKAVLIPVHVIGCDFMYHIFSLNTNLKVGTLDGSEGSLRIQDTESSLYPNDLKELATFCSTIKKELEQYQ